MIMVDIDEIVENLSKLSYRDVLAYWITSEEEEAEFYRRLAGRARALGLPESLAKAFEKLSIDSERHARELTKIFREEFRVDPKTYIPPLEVLPVLEKFERADQIKEVLEAAMESELIAMNAYKTLAEKVEDPKLKELYSNLADVEKGHYETLKMEYEKVGG